MTVIRDPKIDTTTPERTGPPPEVRPVRMWWFAGIVLVALAMLLWVTLALRGQVTRLEDSVRNLRNQSIVPMTVPPTTAPPIDLPPRDAEASRRAINDTFRAVFSAATAPEQWNQLVVDPGDLAARLAPLRSGRCAQATTVLTDIRFTGDDSARVTFHFEGSGVAQAEGVSFTGAAQRTPTGWKAEAGGIAGVVTSATSYCQGR